MPIIESEWSKEFIHNENCGGVMQVIVKIPFADKTGQGFTCDGVCKKCGETDSFRHYTSYYEESEEEEDE